MFCSTFLKSRFIFSLKSIMTRFTRTVNGKCVVNGKTFDMLIGTRAQVWHGTAYKTTGGLTKSNIMKNKSGRIVSKSKYNSAKKDNRLVKAGYGTKKGKFGFVKLNGTSKRGRKSRGKKGMKGGNGVNYSLSPTSYDGQGTGLGNSLNVQFAAGNAN
jgi:hypothetical protein